MKPCLSAALQTHALRKAVTVGGPASEQSTKLLVRLLSAQATPCLLALLAALAEAGHICLIPPPLHFLPEHLLDRLRRNLHRQPHVRVREALLLDRRREPSGEAGIDCCICRRCCRLIRGSDAQSPVRMLARPTRSPERTCETSAILHSYPAITLDLTTLRQHAYQAASREIAGMQETTCGGGGLRISFAATGAGRCKIDAAGGRVPATVCIARCG